MGMSGDFEQAVRACVDSRVGSWHARLLNTRTPAADAAMHVLPSWQVQMGSTNIRVGSTIFGARDYSQQQ
jgi:uncharacterized pyridoxal phosphate-containing UPF0001 family protein